MSYPAVVERLEKSCCDANRAPAEVTLVAVTKNHSAAEIEALIAQGQKTFGENRIQEAAAKWGPLREKHPDIRLHFIGHLQTNKAKDAVALFDVIETVDSERLAAALAAEMKKQGKKLPCFIQVNTGEEEQKGGVRPAEAEALHDFCKGDAGLDIRGLMCIPPENDIPDLHFALLHKLSRQLGLQDLSMGMSADFDRAIAFGATHVRVGTALFE